MTSFVSIGNKADVSSNDLLEWWEEDDLTELVVLYLESFGNPRAFARIARRLARRKPILALKSGTTRAGIRAAGSHTAALAGSDAGADALFAQAGVIRARTLDELIDVAALLSAQPVPRGRRVAVVTNAGGLGILAADACEAFGLELPQPSEETRAALATVMPAEGSAGNPIDLLGGANAESFEQALPPVLADPAFDAAIVLFVPTVGTDEEAVGSAISRAATAAVDKPVLCTFLSAKGAPVSLHSAAHVPSFAYPEAAAKALARAVERGEWLRQPAGAVPELERDRSRARAIVREAIEAGGGWLGPAETRRLLESYSLPIVPERLADTPDAAVEAARDLGYPVVLKTAVAGAHKTEEGGVILDLGDEDAVRVAADKIGGPLLVQPFVRGRSGASGRRRAGSGLRAARRLRPWRRPRRADRRGAVQACAAHRSRCAGARALRQGRRLVAGFRGTPPADESALVDLLLRLSLLAEELPEVAELDLNPVLALPDGCLAVDARIRIAEPEPPHRTKSW